MTKEEKIENYLCSKGLSDEEIKSDTTGLRRITKEIILEAINWACSNLKEEQNKNFSPIQMICDSQGCREVDLFGKPINNELKTLMSPEQLKELTDKEIKTMTRKEQIMDAAMFYAKKNENTPIPYLDFVEAAEWADRTMIEKACEWLIQQEEMIGISFENDFIERFKKAMEE